MGEKVFDMNNKAGSQVRYVKGTTTVSSLKEGVCLSMVLAWIQMTLKDGDMLNSGKLAASMHLITLRQAAFQFNFRANKRAEARFKMNVLQDLFDQYTLKSVQAQSGELISFGEPIDQIRVTPGLYLLYFTGGGAGHAFGFKFTAPGTCYWFDPNVGLFKWPNSDDLSLQLMNLDNSYEKYIVGSYVWRRMELDV
jgi:hypothetical protein